MSCQQAKPSRIVIGGREREGVAKGEGAEITSLATGNIHDE
jgi:hypothetical protein